MSDTDFIVVKVRRITGKLMTSPALRYSARSDAREAAASKSAKSKAFEYRVLPCNDGVIKRRKRKP